MLFHVIHRLRGRWCLALLALLSSQVAAQPSLTLREALSRSLEHSPALAEFPYRQRAAEARALQASLSPNPELSLEVENLAGSGRFDGADSAEVTLALSQVIELGNKRRQREAVARLAGTRVQRAYERARLDVLTDTAGRFLAVERAERQLALARTAEALAEAVEQAARRRVEAGHSSDAELSRARIAQLRAELAVTAAERSLAVQRRALAASWSSTEAGFGSVQADLFALPAVPDYASLVARLMAMEGVSCKLVVNAQQEFIGLLTAERLSEQYILVAQTLQGVERGDLTAGDLMLPRASIPALDLEALTSATVGDLVQVLRETGETHCLVLDRDQHHIRGVIAVDDIAERLHREVPIAPKRSIARALSS